MEFKQLTVTCRINGCGNKDIPLTINVPNEPDPRVVCGPCGNDITDKHD